MSEVELPVPDSLFVLNHAINYFADLAAKSVEFLVHVASGALYYNKLIAFNDGSSE